MKITKTLALLCVLGAGLLAITSCKDVSGDGKTTGATEGVNEKWALQMTVDATGDQIKVGDKAITDANGGTDDTDTTGIIIADDDTTGDANLKLSQTGKRFYKEITPGFNNTEGFRTNIVLNVKDGIWQNANKTRTAGAGMLFDYNEYEKVAGTKTYDFFFLSFKPEFSDAGAITKVKCYFERYSGVKKTKKGVYSGHAKAAAIGNNYIQETNKYTTTADTPIADADYTLKTFGKWLQTLYEPAAEATCYKYLTKDTDYYLNTDGNAVIGVDVKQLEKGEYTVRIGKISYKVKDEATEFTPSNFKESWKTTFTAGTTMGKGGDKAGTSCITGYENWTHVKKDDKKTNLKGGVMVYGFAPYGTKPVASYYTCNTKLASDTADTEGSGTDFVGDWSRVNDVNDDGIIYDYVYF